MHACYTKCIYIYIASKRFIPADSRRGTPHVPGQTKAEAEAEPAAERASERYSGPGGRGRGGRGEGAERDKRHSDRDRDTERLAICSNIFRSLRASIPWLIDLV